MTSRLANRFPSMAASGALAAVVLAESALLAAIYLRAGVVDPYWMSVDVVFNAAGLPIGAAPPYWHGPRTILSSCGHWPPEASMGSSRMTRKPRWLH